MFGRSKTQAIKDNAVNGTELALALARDRKFREQLTSAIGHAAAARRRAASRFGLMAVAARLAADEELRRELAAALDALDHARRRVERKRSHTLRNTMLVLAGGAGAFAAYKLRGKVPQGSGASDTVDRHADAAVPVATAEPQG
ncbi:MAG: hypothetical protein ACJ75Q_04100 [Gaiellaceae bacterium]